jgi:hypothetical protein
LKKEEKGGHGKTNEMHPEVIEEDAGMATLQCNFSPAAVHWRSS